MKHPKIAIIGGTGLYQIEGLRFLEERQITTPFGKTSDALILGEWEDTPVIFLPRHGRAHNILPSELNFRANIYALKLLGVEFILSVSAVGSLREEIKPGHLVMVDQFIDRTFGRASSFFGEGVVAHVGFAEPICPVLREKLFEASQKEDLIAHPHGTYVCIEGPMFSSRAESRLYQSWGADVIGMTNLQEARLAREAGICYATLALSTDYDCWHEDHASVTAQMVMETLRANIEKAQRVLCRVLPKVLGKRSCYCSRALRHAVVTPAPYISEEVKKRLAPIIKF